MAKSDVCHWNGNCITLTIVFRFASFDFFFFLNFYFFLIRNLLLQPSRQSVYWPTTNFSWFWLYLSIVFDFHFICFVFWCDFSFKQSDFLLLLLLFYLLLFDQKRLCCNPHWKMFKCENVNRLNWINIIHVKKFDEVEWWDL